MADRHWGGAVKGGTTENEKTVLSVSCSLCPTCSSSLPQEHVSFWRFWGDNLLFVTITGKLSKEGILYLIVAVDYDSMFTNI